MKYYLIYYNNNMMSRIFLILRQALTGRSLSAIQEGDQNNHLRAIICNMFV